MFNQDITPDNVDSLFDDAAGHLNALNGRLIDLTAWLLGNTREWQGESLWTPAQYLAWRAGVSSSTAANLVLAAERTDDLPVAIDMVRRGEMSLDQLMPLVRKVPSWADAQAASLAHRLTVSQVRRLVNETNWAWQPGAPADEEPETDNTDAPASSAEPADPTDNNPERADAGSSECSDEPPPDENRVSYGYGVDGRWFLYANLDPDLGAIVGASLDEARDALFREVNHVPLDDDADTTGDEAAAEAPLSRTPGVITPISDADALAELARRSMNAVESEARGNRFRVNMFIDLNGSMTTQKRTAMPDSIARLLTCDGRIDPVFTEASIPVSVGRTQRTTPDRLRRLVLHRDHHSCQVPGCTASRGLDLHHIIHWADEGPTDSGNLITICSRHHRMHHEKRLGISGNADHPESLVFHNAYGRVMKRSGTSPNPPTGPPPPITGLYEHPSGERLDRRWVTFVDPTFPPAMCNSTQASPADHFELSQPPAPVNSPSPPKRVALVSVHAADR